MRDRVPMLLLNDCRAEEARNVKRAALESIDAVATAWAGCPQVAVFDTSYYAALP